MRHAQQPPSVQIEYNQHPKTPTYDQLLWPTLKALKALGGSGSNQEILDKIIELEKFSEEVQSLIQPGQNVPLLSYRAGWARTYLKKFEAIDNSRRGVWTLLDKGEKLTQSQVQAIARSVKFKDAQARIHKLPTGETLDSDSEEQEESWKDQLLALLQSMKPEAFERLCQRILRESGFINVHITGRSGDGGIDGVGILRMKLVSFHVPFQCKRYKGSVGSPAIRDFRGALTGRADKGLFITTGSFTAEARKEANREGASPLDLIDGEELCEILKSLGLGVVIKQVEHVIVQPQWFEGV